MKYHYTQFSISKCFINSSSQTLPGSVSYKFRITRTFEVSHHSSFSLKAILLMFSLNILDNVLPNFCCDLSIILLLPRHLFVILKFDLSFDNFFCSLCFLVNTSVIFEIAVRLRSQG